MLPLVSVREGLVSVSIWWEGLVSAGFGSFQVVSAGFGSFQVVSAGFGSFRFLVIMLSVWGQTYFLDGVFHGHKLSFNFLSGDYKVGTEVPLFDLGRQGT